MNLPTTRPTYRRWTAEEDVLLREGWGTQSLEQLADRLKRTPGSVKQHACDLLLPSLQPQKPPAARPRTSPQELASQRQDSITDVLQTRLMKVVEELGMRKLADMDPDRAQAALALLRQHQAKLDHAPGARRLFERLAGYLGSHSGRTEKQR